MRIFPRETNYQMNYKKINNFDVYLYNCDLIGNYHNIQIFKKLLHFLAEEEIKLDHYLFEGLSEMETRGLLNRLEKEYL